MVPTSVNGYPSPVHGFVREGMVRQGKLVNTWCDYYLYGLLRSDVEG